MEIVKQKNVATIISFPLVDANGALVSASANPDSEIDAYTDDAIPNGFVACTNEAIEVGATGWYHLSLTQAEMNVDYINLQIKSDDALTQCLIIRTIVGDPLNLSVHSAADVWTTGSRELSTPANYKATGFSTHNAAAIWAEVTKEITGGVLTTPADYKATGFSVHSAADVWSVGTRLITGGVLTTPADYKATGFSTHNAADVWTTGSRALSTPNDYKATGFSTHAAADVWGVGTRQLSGTIGDFDALDTALDSAHGAGSWLTGGGGSGISIQTIPSIPKNIDLSNTKTVRIALYVNDQSDDLPTTGEITEGTIKIERSADGGTSWSTIRDDLACSKHAGGIYYDEVFSSGNGYASADMIRITFKSQIVTIDANDFEITDATSGMVFITRIDSGLSGGGPSAGDIADAVWNEPIADHTDNAQFGGKNQKVVPSETLADYKATGFSTHVPADVWTAGSRALSTPSDYKAIGFSVPNEYDTVIASLQTDLDNPTQYKATGFSIHSADDVWSVVSRIITGGVLTTPADYKATGFSVPNEYDVVIATLALEATVNALNNITTADVWDKVLTADTHNIASSAGRRLRQLGDVLNANVEDVSPTNVSFITDLTENTDDFYTEQYLRFVEGNLAGQVRIITAYNGTTKRITICPDHPFTEAPVNGDEFGLIPVHVHALSEIINRVWTEGGRSLSTPSDYKADVSSLALEATVLAIKTLTDNLPADTELELIKLKGLGGIWLVAEYHHDANNDNDYIQFWQYGNQTDFDNETKVNAINKWRQDISYSTNLPVKSKWDKVT